MTNAATAQTLSKTAFSGGINGLLQAIASEKSNLFFGRAIRWEQGIILPIVLGSYPYNRRYLTSGEMRPTVTEPAPSVSTRDRFNVSNRGNAVVILPAGTHIQERVVKRDAVLYPGSTGTAWLYTKAERIQEPPRIKIYDDQVGAVAISKGRFALEVFDYPISFKSMDGVCLYGVGIEASPEERKTAIDVARARLVAQPLKFFPHWEHRPKNGGAQSRVLSIVSQQLDGSATELNKSLIHLYLYAPRPW